MESLPDLIDAWWQYQRLTTGTRPERLAADDWSWAWEEVTAMINDKDERVVEFLVSLAESAQSPEDLQIVGAGPIEDLLSEHGKWLATTEGSAMLDQLADNSRTSKKFRQALGSVWHESGEIPLGVRERLIGLSTPMDT
jgi:hypothetical protein